jgi:hypothetical protein
MNSALFAGDDVDMVLSQTGRLSRPWRVFRASTSRFPQTANNIDTCASNATTEDTYHEPL